MQMLEKVARALCEADSADPDYDAGDDGMVWTWYIDKAKVAIQAMRDPTPDMLIHAGCVEGWCDESEYSAGADHDHITWWNSMIDAAANTPPQEINRADD